MASQHTVPFLRLLLPLMAGILLATRWVPDLGIAALFAVAVILLIISLFAYYFNRNYQRRWLFGFSLFLLLTVIGMYRVSSVKQNFENTKLPPDTVQYLFYVARLTEPPLRKEQTYRILAEVKAIDELGEWVDGNERMLIYLQLDQIPASLTYGSRIGFVASPQPVAGPVNPEQFDYQNYLSQKGIYRQVFLRKSDWQILEGKKQNLIYSIAFRCRSFLMKVLESNEIKGEEYAVAAAILLGYDEGLPSYLRQSYVASGAMHILSVSGLHVGIVYLFFNFFLSLLIRNKKYLKIKGLILFSLIWFYALITGLSPSVLRSALMISFILLAESTRRKGNLINSLAASAFLLLLVQPMTLFQIGFQLTYSAVLGIALFYDPIVSWFGFSNKVVNYFWEGIAVTLSAQLTTSPLVLYYFHQFPVYFILGNILLIPLSFVILVSGMTLLMLFYLPILPFWIGKLTAVLIYIMNFAVKRIESLPGSVMDGLYINGLESSLLVVLVLILWQMSDQKFRKWLIPSLLVAVIFFFSLTVRKFETIRSTEIVVYGVNRHTAIDLIAGIDHVTLADSSFWADPFSVDFNLSGFWAAKGLKRQKSGLELFSNGISTKVVKQSKDLVSFAGKLFSVWDGRFGPPHAPIEPQEIDFVVITGNQKANLVSVLRLYKIKLMVIDMSVPVWRETDWQIQARKEGVECYSIRKQGAWRLRID